MIYLGHTRTAARGNIMTTATILPIVKHLYRRYAHDATKRNKNFDISLEYFNELIVQPCAYCGAETDNTYRQPQYAVKELKYNGIDRVDSTGGYTTDNTVACCGQCNRAKSNHDTSFVSSQWLRDRIVNISINVKVTVTND